MKEKRRNKAGCHRQKFNKSIKMLPVFVRACACAFWDIDKTLAYLRTSNDIQNWIGYMNMNISMQNYSLYYCLRLKWMFNLMTCYSTPLL